MDKTYCPKLIETHWYPIWEEQGYFAPDLTNGQGDPYCIMIPPPNVTGRLHMGHGFNNTIMDILIRYQRMTGRPVLWQAGTDHAGIATQMVVERQLEQQEGETRHHLGRKAFIEKIWQWRDEAGGNITQQLRRMGSSLDWQNERFTMDKGLCEAVTEVFVRLYEEGLIYRGKRLVNWDPVLHTAISDLEVLSEEEDGNLWHIKYPLLDGSDYVVVATTRPETLLGDCAVAIHPDDARYQHLIGKQLQLPLTGRTIPIITDATHVDPQFGTGCVKITPAHDFNDYAFWQRHQAVLATQIHAGLINIFTIDAMIRDNDPDEQTTPPLIPPAYVGMDRYIARKQILSDLQRDHLLVVSKKHRLMIPRGDRSGAIIEPFLTDQWYVKTAHLAKPAIQAVQAGHVRFVPDNWKHTYYRWMETIQDWCISRQIWWGHRIPAWYDPDGNLYVGKSETAVRKKHQLAADCLLRQDEDVLDTWFSSALWPFSTLGWPKQTTRLQRFYPTSVLVTGFDIIFFWVARMMMMGIKFMDGKPPFKTIYIHGLVRDAQGQKMSKSKGNVLDPIDLIDGIDLQSLIKKRTTGMLQPKLAKSIEKMTREAFPQGIPAFGTDALRFTFAAMASTGRDIQFDISRIEGYRNFCNKLWNAARYVRMHSKPGDAMFDPDLDLSITDQWIMSCLQETTQTMHDAIEHYRFDYMAQAIYDFVWNQYCAWYLEFSKCTLNNDASSEQQKRATRQTLLHVLEVILRLAHPIIPYITEEIWQAITPLTKIKGKTIMLQPYPSAQAASSWPNDNQAIQWLQTLILGIRRIKSEMDIAPHRLVPILLAQTSDTDRHRITTLRPYINDMAKVKSITLIDNEQDAPDSAIALVDQMRVLMPLAGLIDKNAELARLQKAIDKLNSDIQRLSNKLSNQHFLSKAPQTIVSKEQAKLAKAKADLTALKAQSHKITGI